MKISFAKLNGAVASPHFSGETVTVAALINALGSFDPDAIVITEGCDCDGEVLSVSDDEPGIVYLSRRA